MTSLHLPYNNRMANTAICTYYFPFCKFCSKYDSRCPRNHSRFTHNTFNFIRSLKIPFDTSLSLLSCRYLDGNKNAIGKKHKQTNKQIKRKQYLPTDLA